MGPGFLWMNQLNPHDEIPHRQAARILLVDPQLRVLLFRFADPVTAEPFWITPGGGLDDGESFEQAAVRELREETGVIACHSELSPCVWTRTHDVRYGHKRFHQYEQFYLLRVSRSEIDTQGMLDYETRDLTEHRWWATEDIKISTEQFAPRQLGRQLEMLLSGALPTSPIDIGR